MSHDDRREKSMPCLSRRSVAGPNRGTVASRVHCGPSRRPDRLGIRLGRRRGDLAVIYLGSRGARSRLAVDFGCRERPIAISMQPLPSNLRASANVNVTSNPRVESDALARLTRTRYIA